MDLTILLEIGGLLASGGLGALLMQVYNAKVNKSKLKAEAEEVQASADRKKQDNKQDAFDTLYQQLNKCMSDYAEISEKYREHQENARKYEETVRTEILDKQIELAALKSKIAYLKGIRCYNTLCPNRILIDPDSNRDTEDNEY